MNNGAELWIVKKKQSLDYKWMFIQEVVSNICLHAFCLGCQTTGASLL